MNNPNDRLQYKPKKIVTELSCRDTVNLANIENIQQTVTTKTSTCFAGHTLIRIYSDENIAQRYKRIEEIKVGDTVWSAPENGLGDEVRKRVTNIFKHEQQAVWLLAYYPHELGTQNTMSRISAEAVTPNHPVCVYGYAPQITKEEEDNPIEFYETPQWKAVEDLKVGEVLYNPLGGRYYIVTVVKPLYKSTLSPDCAWLQGGKDMAEWQYSGYGDIWLINNIPKGRTNTGRIFEVDDFKQNDAYCIKDKLACPTILYDEDGNITDEYAAGFAYEPFVTTVYNIEVEDYHTYCVGERGILVHNKNTTA